MTVAAGTRLPLDEGWTVRPVLGDAWRWEVERAPTAPPAPGWIAARVPGSVLDDAWRAGLVPDPERDLGSLAAEWVPARHWIHRRALRGDSAWNGRRVTLELGGVDWAATAWLDGEPLGRHASQLIPWHIDLTGRLQADRDSTLLVVLEPAPPNEPQVGDTSRVRIHRTRMTEGWDFCPRMPHLGLWRPVALRLTGAARIDDLGVTVDVAEGEGRLAVRPTVDLALAGPVGVTVRVSHAGQVLAEASWSGDAEAGTAALPAIGLRVPEPPVWHVNGEGEQPLCELRVCVTHGGVPSDVAARRIGFRSLRFAPPPGAPAGARAYTPVVNGRAVPVRGWNWVPVDARYGVPRPERIAHLVDLARRARVNLLRVWGGGLIEDEAFYAACDAAGILVWQELLQSSSGIADLPSLDPAWAEMLAAEARAIAPSRSHHPSLALWCGGNELRGEDAAPADERHPAIAAARDALATVDPGRHWLPTSPSGPTFLFTAPPADDPGRVDPDLNDVHGPWEHQGLAAQQTLWGGRLALLHSEFGASGMCGREQLDATVSADLQAPPTRENPVMRHRGDWWIDAPGVRAAFGAAVADDLERTRRASRLLQAEGVRVAVEAARRAWPRTAGTLPWQLDESFPNAWCTAAIDHDGRPRPVYHAVRRAYAARGAAAWVPTPAIGDAHRLDGRAWAWLEDAAAGTAVGLRVELRTADGLGAARGSWPGPGREPHRLAGTGVVGSVRWSLALPDPTDDPAGRVLVLDVALEADPGAGGEPGLPARYLLTRAADLAPLAALPSTDLRVDRDPTGVAITNAGPVLAVDVHLALPAGLDGVPAIALDDAFHLLPGETRHVGIAWRDVPDPGRRVVVDAWNAPRVVA